MTNVDVKPGPEKEKDQKSKKGEEERPPQQDELLCTICGMRSCWR